VHSAKFDRCHDKVRSHGNAGAARKVWATAVEVVAHTTAATRRRSPTSDLSPATLPLVTGGQIFVDETKQRDYPLVAGVVLPGDLRRTRAVIRGLVVGVQRQVHMGQESVRRPRLIAAAICETGVRTTIYDAGRGNRGELEARGPSCTRWSGRGCYRRREACAEQDDSLLRWDNQRLVEITREVACRDTLRWEYRRAAAERLLAVPDAIA